MKIIRTPITEGDAFKEGSRNSTKTNVGKKTTIVVENGSEPDEFEEKTVIVKVLKPRKPKLETIVS